MVTDIADAQEDTTDSADVFSRDNEDAYNDNNKYMKSKLMDVQTSLRVRLKSLRSGETESSQTPKEQLETQRLTHVTQKDNEAVQLETRDDQGIIVQREVESRDSQVSMSNDQTVVLQRNKREMVLQKEREMDVSNSTVETKEQKIEVAKAKLEELKRTLDLASETGLKENVVETESLENELKLSGDKVSILLSEREALQKKVHLQSEELSKHKKMEDAETHKEEQSQQKIQSLSQTNSLLILENERLKKRVSTMVDSQELALAEKRIKNLEASVYQMKPLQSMLDNSRAANAVSISENQRLELQIKADLKKISVLEKTFSEELEYYKTALTDAEAKLMEGQEVMKEFKRLQGVEASLKAVENQLRISREANEVFMEENESLEKKLKEELEIALSGSDNLETEFLKKLEDQKNVFEREKALMQNQLMQAQRIIEEKDEELRDFQINAERDKRVDGKVVDAQIQLLQKQLRQFKFEKDSDYARFASVVQEDAANLDDDKISSFGYSKEEVEALKAENNHLNVELEQMQHKLENRKGPSLESQLEDEKTTHESYKQTMETKLKEAKKEVQASVTELDRLREVVRAKEASPSDVSSQLENQKAAFLKEKAEMQKELIKVQGAIMQKEEELRNFAIEVEKDKKREATMAKAQIGILQKQIKQMKRINLENDPDYRRVALSSLVDETSPDQSEDLNHEDIIAASKIEIRALKEELEKLKLELEERKDPSCEHQSEDGGKQLEEQSTMHESYKQTMEKKLNEAEKKVQASMTELDRLREAETKVGQDPENAALKTWIAELRKELREIKIAHKQAKSDLEAKKKECENILKGKGRIDRLENLDASEIESELREALVANEILRSEKVKLQKEMRDIEGKLPNLERTLAAEVQKIRDNAKSREAQQMATGDEGALKEKVERQYMVQLKKQRSLFEKIKSDIEAKLATAQESLLAKEKEVTVCNSELESLRKKVEECRRVSNDSDTADYYSNKLEQANKEIESLRTEVKKFRSIFDD